jgi:DNA anti-recombination protein RmuC
MELKLLQIKLFFVKIAAFVKVHWVEIFFALTALYVYIFAKQKQAVIEQLISEQQKIREQHKKNIEDLTKQIEEQITQRRKIESDYQNLIKQINERHDQQIKDIAKVKEKEIKELISKHQGDPTKMAMTINELFGIPILGVTDQ